MKTFTGELYSYDDARTRVPAAWQGREQRPGFVGLGHFERHPDGKGWVYVQRNGLAIPITENWGKPTPPPLPKNNPTQANCWHGPHTCSACGTPYWHEYHGVADGECSYCYYRG